MLKLIYVLMCFVCVSGLYSQSLDLIFHNSFNTLISDVAIAKDSTFYVNEQGVAFTSCSNILQRRIK